MPVICPASRGCERSAPAGPRRRRWLVGLMAGTAVLLVWACGAAVDKYPVTSDPASASEITVAVVDVIDGDTIAVAMEHGIERVRYIGIDTPEVGDRCADEATAANRQLVGDGAVRLIRDVENRDLYGRLLRYVYSGDTFVNLELVELGLAGRLRIRPNEAHADEIAGAEGEAKREGRGCLWDPGALAEEKRLEALATPTPTPALRLVVERFHFNAAGRDGENLNDEYVTLINLGEDLQVSGWTAADAAGNSFTFPAYGWRTGARITLHSGRGDDGDGRFFWGSGSPIWNNDHDELTIRDGLGQWVLSYGYRN